MEIVERARQFADDVLFPAALATFATVCAVQEARAGGCLTTAAQRLWREALFVLVYALRPASRDALLVWLGAA